jgi:uncharacterized protein (DUF4415 family)
MKILKCPGAARIFWLRAKTIHVRHSVALDAEVVDWFEGNAAPGEDFESRINSVLSEHVAERTRKAS